MGSVTDRVLCLVYFILLLSLPLFLNLSFLGLGICSIFSPFSKPSFFPLDVLPYLTLLKSFLSLPL